MRSLVFSPIRGRNGGHRGARVRQGKARRAGRRSGPPAAPNVVHVEAADYSFKAPDSLPSGVTTFT
jgi:hypothetical protein